MTGQPPSPWSYISAQRPASLSQATVAGGLLDATGATVVGARQLTAGSDVAWEVTVRPDGGGDIALRLPVRPCGKPKRNMRRRAAACAGSGDDDRRRALDGVVLRGRRTSTPGAARSNSSFG